MSAGIRAIREGIATALAGVVTCYDTLPASPIPPFAVVMWPDLITFNARMSGLHQYDLSVDVWVSLADVTSGQKQLDDLIDGGIKAALEEATTPPWRTIHVQSVRDIRPESLDSIRCLAASFTITAIG